MVLAINSVSSAVGSFLPKAIWYSTFFRNEGYPSFADEIARVYGLCTIVLALYLASYFFGQLFKSGKAQPLDETERLVLSVPASRDRLKYVENIVLGCGVLTAYYDFVGYGLSKPGGIPSETTNGAYVLGGPIFFFAVLAVVVIYCYKSRTFLRRSVGSL